MTGVKPLLLVAALTLAACDGRRTDQLDAFASASCAALQQWIDAIEDETVALSRAVTAVDDPSARVPHFKAFAAAADLRTWDTIRQLERIAPLHGDGRAAADLLVAAMEESRGVTQDLVARADSFPTDGDDEPLTGRISSLFIRLEKAFSLANHARDDLAASYPAFDDVPSCADLADAVS